MPKARGSGFFVGELPYAVWEWDMPDRNLGFVREIEHEFFEYVATTHLEHLDGDRCHLAALSLRAAYFHGLETLFTLICAAIQAPRCVPGWIQRCSTPQLRQLIEEISRGTCQAPNPLKLRPISWSSVAERIIRFSDTKEEKLAEIQSEFDGLWTRLSGDWLEHISINEYNSIKHGLRIRPGGFSLAVGIQQEPGVPAPPEDMQFVGHSEFGTSFFHAEPVQNAADPSKTHFRLKKHCSNWNPGSMCQCLQLISMSIANVKGFLRIYNGDPPSEVQMFRLQDHDDYWAPWLETPSVANASMDTIVTEANIDRLSKKALAERLLENYGLVDDSAASNNGN